MSKLVNLGSLCIDHVYRVARLAGAGETLASSSHEVFPGGKGLNQSLAAARAGASVEHIGCVGSDGELLRSVLQEAGVDVSGVRTDPDSASGHAVIQVNEAGENAIVIAGGANRRVNAADLDSAFERLEATDWLLLQNEINDLETILARAAETPARVAFNVAPVDGREADYELKGIDLLIVNEIEARALVSESDAVRDDDSVALSLAGQYPDMDVVLTAGSSGLVHARGERVNRLAALAVTAVDETAAGDAFIGFLMADLLAGQSMENALQTGSAAGALAVTVPGAASSIPSKQAVAGLLSAQRDSPVTS